MPHYNTVIIGAGFTGIAASKLLKQSAIDHVVIEKLNKLGSFLHQTWDTFQFGMTIDDFKLPGLDLTKQFPPNHRLTRDEGIKIIQEYAKDLPIRLKAEVRNLTKDEKGIFQVDLGAEVITANNIIVCTGPHHAQKFPLWARIFCHKAIMVTHFKNPDSFKDHARVLVIGSGLSALSVAYDLKTSKAKSLQIAIACGYDDKQVFASNAHQFSKGKPEHFLKIMPSRFQQNGIFNYGRLIETTSTDIIFETKNGKYAFPIDYFDHIILATGFTYSFDLFKNFPQVGVYNGLPIHAKCKTAVSQLFIAGVAHQHQSDRVVTITQGTEDAKLVHGFIRAKL